MCHLNFSHFTGIKSLIERNVWMPRDRAQKKAHQLFFIRARVMITSAGSQMITKLKGNKAESAWAQIVFLSEKGILLCWLIAISAVHWNLPSGSSLNRISL